MINQGILWVSYNITSCSHHIHWVFMYKAESCWDTSLQWSLVLTKSLLLYLKTVYQKKKRFPVKNVFVGFHSYSLLIKPYIILSFSRQAFKALVAEQRFAGFGILWERSLMGGLWVGWNIKLGLGEESCFCTAGKVQKAESGIKKWSVKYFLAF